MPPTDVPPTDVPPTDVPPTDVPPTDVPPTDVPPTDVPPTDVPPTATPTLDPGGPPSGVSCSQNLDFGDGLHLVVFWQDNTTFETEFVVEYSGDGGGSWSELVVTPTTNKVGTGDIEVYAPADPFPLGTTFQFRVKARDGQSGAETAFSSASSGCTTTATDAAGAYCMEGQIYLQGRSDHAGMPVYLDGEPVAATGSDGSFEACGLPEGQHTVSTGGGCYLDTVPMGVVIQQDGVARAAPDRSRGR